MRSCCDKGEFCGSGNVTENRLSSAIMWIKVVRTITESREVEQEGFSEGFASFNRTSVFDDLAIHARRIWIVV